VFELLLGILKFFPGPHTQIYRNSEELAGFIVESIEKYQQTLDLSAPRDFIDSFLIRMDKARTRSDWEWAGKSLHDTMLTLR
jgi:cytochrome P450 family 2 subfamily B